MLRGGAAGMILLMTVASAMAPLAGAEHIATAQAAQVAAGPDGAVTIAFHLAATGNPNGGSWFWSTGDGAGGWLDDGFWGGVYQGDEEGSTTLTDGRRVDWSRRGAQEPVRFGGDLGQPAEVVYTVTYHYPRPGAYLVGWSNCCREYDAWLLVATANADDPRRAPHVPIFFPNACAYLDEWFVDCAQKWMARGGVGA